MRIARSTPDELIVRESPRFLAAIMTLFSVGLPAIVYAERADISALGAGAALVMAAVCAGVLVFAVRVVTVSFTKSIGRIEIDTASLRGRERRSLALNQLIEAREEILSGDGDTSRVVLVFNAEMAATLDPVERARLEKERALGLRRAGVTEIPLTVYFSGDRDARRIAAAINEWRSGGEKIRAGDSPRRPS